MLTETLSYSTPSDAERVPWTSRLPQLRAFAGLVSGSVSINLGNGLTAPEFDVQSVLTTVAANDGETVAIGGLISKTDTKSENKIPWFGDLPYVGAAFRYRTQSKSKRELMIILTPHVAWASQEAMQILADQLIDNIEAFVAGNPRNVVTD